MTERRYTEEEVAAIFERAAAEQHSPRRQLPPAEGMTLAQLHEIGREVGIPAELVTRSAQSLEQAGRPAGRTLMGLPLGVGRTVELPRRLTDSEWEQIVADLRDTFQARGSLRYDGSFREWSNGNLSVMLEPTPGGHRVRMQTTNGQLRELMSVGVVLTGMGTLLSIVMLAADKAKGLTVSALFFAMGLGAIVFGALRLPAWARLRRSQMEALAGRIALMAEAPPPRDLPPARD